MTETEQTEPVEQYPPKPTFPEDPNILFRSFWGLLLLLIAAYSSLSDGTHYLSYLFLTVVLHDLGHIGAMYLIRYKNLNWVLIPILGKFLKKQKSQITKSEQVGIILAGPLPGIVLGLLILLVDFGLDESTRLVAGNILLIFNSINLLPLLPLDGGRLLETLFYKYHYGLQIGFMIFASLLLILIGLATERFILLAIPIFFYLVGFRSSKARTIRKKLKRKQQAYQGPYEQLSDEGYWKIREEVVRHFSAFRHVTPDNYELNPQEKQIALQVRLVLENRPRANLGFFSKLGAIVIWGLGILSALVGIMISFSDKTMDSIASPEQKALLIENCLRESPDIADRYPDIRLEYCECMVDSLLKQISVQDLLLFGDFSNEKWLEEYLPTIQPCVDTMHLKIGEIFDKRMMEEAEDSSEDP